ncbi:MAG: hypothetical protein ACYDCX_04940 [Acidithiobacillus sp.]
MEGRPRGKREKFPILVNLFHVFPDLAVGKGCFAATSAQAVVVIGESLRPAGELFEPKGRVFACQQDEP